MKYQTLRNFLLLLAHPISILVMIVLFVNDHILRINWPSWWTGKIGDFAWLFFAPFALAALISLFFPTRSPLEKQIGTVAFVLTAGIFIMAKIVPAANAFLVHQTSWLLGIPIRITLDPSDLVALIVLPFSFWFWRRTKRVEVQFPKRAWVVLPFAALLTIANSAAPNLGIDCFNIVEQKIIAYSGVYSYVSDNGGLSWTEYALSAPDCNNNSQIGTIRDLNDPNTLYYFSPGGNIEKSVDGGATKQLEFDISEGNPFKRAYYEKALRDESPIPLIGPLDAIFDPDTGNLILAMGNEGALIRQVDGNWQWITIGGHQRKKISGFEGIYILLSTEIWLAFLLGSQLLLTWAVFLRRHWIKELLLGLIWIIWLFLFFILSSVSRNYYGLSVSDIFFMISGLLICLFSLPAIWGAIKHKHLAFLQVIGHAFVSSLLFLLPYYLWIVGVISNYNIAIFFAIMFSLINFFSGYNLVMKLSKPQNIS